MEPRPSDWERGLEFDFILGTMGKTLVGFRSGYLWYMHGPAEAGDLIRAVFEKGDLLPS